MIISLRLSLLISAITPAMLSFAMGAFYFLWVLCMFSLFLMTMGVPALPNSSIIHATCLLSRPDFHYACSFSECSVLVHVIPHSRAVPFALKNFMPEQDDVRHFNLPQITSTVPTSLSCYFLSHNSRHVYFRRTSRYMVFNPLVRTGGEVNSGIIAVVAILAILGVFLPYVFILRSNPCASPDHCCILALRRLGLYSRDPAPSLRRMPPPVPNTVHYRPPVHPPMTQPRRTFADLVQESIISEEETDQLRMQSWLCCICLEDVPSNSSSPPIARLNCGHATHAQCLRMWLEKGRAVCCLCNAPAVSSVNDDCTSSDTASVSVFDPTASSSVSESTEFSSFSRSYSLLTEGESFEPGSNSLSR